MEETKKITKEELEDIQKTTQIARDLLLEIGKMDYQKHIFALDLDEQNIKIEKIKSDFKKKYGDVEINLLDGAYKKIEQDVENKKD